MSNFQKTTRWWNAKIRGIENAIEGTQLGLVEIRADKDSPVWERHLKRQGHLAQLRFLRKERVKVRKAFQVWFTSTETKLRRLEDRFESLKDSDRADDHLEAQSLFRQAGSLREALFV